MAVRETFVLEKCHSLSLGTVLGSQAQIQSTWAGQMLRWLWWTQPEGFIWHQHSSGGFPTHSCRCLANS